MTLAYDSELSREQFEGFLDLLAPDAKTGRPRTVDLMRVWQAIGNVLDLCLVSLAIMEDATYRESAHRSSVLPDIAGNT